MQWINQADLRNWADRIGSREEFPVLVRDLVLASAQDVGDIRDMRFPGGESSQVRGYDGDLTMAIGSTYVPVGRSIWEFGTNDDPVEKFKSDYDTRVKDTAPADRAKLTFVFVTPRNWDNPRLKLPDWLKTYKDKNDFADVRYIDGAMLETWLEQHHAVGAKHARLVLGHMPHTGVRSTDEFWTEFSARYRPQLTEAVALCARQEQADQILTHLLGKRGSLVLVGDGPDEVSAVAVAAIRSAAETDRQYLEARTLVVDTDEAGRLVSVPDRYGYIVSPSVKEVAGALATYGPTVTSLDFRPSGSKFTRLERPSTRAMSEALQTTGLDEEAAEALALKSGRSLTILERHAHAAGYSRAAWAEGGDRLIAALLAGGWSTRHEGDRAILAELSGLDYDDYELAIRPYLEKHDSPLDHQAGIWKLRAPVDAFVNLSHLVVRKHLTALAAAALKVFSTEETPDPSEERFGVSKAPYSTWLRDGLATTLLIIAAMHEEVGLESIDDPDGFVRDIVESLPGLNSDLRVVLSLERQLIYLMEATPHPLLGALEHLLEGEAPVVQQLFVENTGFGGARSRLPNVLWALEMLAWDPAYLPRVALLLAKLASLDPGGRSGNRPISSLRDIFVAWKPDTNAPLVERLAVIDTIIEAHPNVGWQLLMQLMPRLQDFKSPTQRPRFREAGASEREQLTYGLVSETYDALIDRALSAIGSDPKHWTTMADAFPRFSPERRIQFLEMLSAYVSEIVGEQRDELRRTLRRLADRHARFPDAEWALPTPELNRLKRIVTMLESSDPFDQARMLFDEWMPFPAKDYEAAQRAIEQRRKDAVASLAAAQGAEALLRLANSVRLPRLVAAAAARGIADQEMLDEMLNAGAPDEPAPDFASSLAGSLRWERGSDFDAHIIELAKRKGWAPIRTASVLLDWPEAPETWQLVDSLGSEPAEYFWSRREPRRFAGSADQLETLVLKFVAAGRPGTALEALHGRERELSWPTIATLLGTRIAEINSRGLNSDLDDYYVDEMFKSLRERDDVPKLDLARWEYAFFPVLEHKGTNLALFDLMASDPEFFVSILKDVYVEDGTDPGAMETTEAERARGNASHRILIAFDRVPGEADGVIDETAMTAWVDGMIEEGKKARRSGIVPSYIGRVLAHAAPEQDVWPPTAVARTIERLKSEELEQGMMIERFNMRGVFTKAMFEGGREERDLAQEARNWAKARAAFPRTRAMLNLIAERWDGDAKRADEHAQRDRLRFE
jgi:hypothetical protein